MLSSVSRYNTPLQQLLLLEERVRRAGVTLPGDAEQEERFHGIRCVINSLHCLLDIRAVAEVIEHRPVTPIPGSRTWIEGVMNFRGVLVPVFNLRAYFKKDHADASDRRGKSGALVVCRIGQEKHALRIDRVTGMQKYLLKDFMVTTSQDVNPRSPRHYIDACIEIGDQSWWRFDVKALLNDLICQEPMQRPAETA